MIKLNAFFPYHPAAPTPSRLIMTETLIECPVCFEPTTNILDNTCKHPLCLACVNKIKSNSRTFSPTGILILACPLCRINSKPSYEEIEARCIVITSQRPIDQPRARVVQPLPPTVELGRATVNAYTIALQYEAAQAQFQQAQDIFQQAQVRLQQARTETQDQLRLVQEAQARIPEVQVRFPEFRAYAGERRSDPRYRDPEFQARARTILNRLSTVYPVEGRYYPKRGSCVGVGCMKKTQVTCKGSGCYHLKIHRKVCWNCGLCSDECCYFNPEQLA